MPQLSIVIPFTDDTERFESTLVSVLENRPASCEIIVTHAGNYSDPYNLASEVHFVEIADNTSSQKARGSSTDRLGAHLAAAVERASSPILHLLGCGVKVNHGWCDNIAEDFDDPCIGSVCPIIKDDKENVLCVGIENTLFYKNRFVGAGKFAAEIDAEYQNPIGPHQVAGFYSVEAISQVDCLQDFGETSFGLELALTLEAIGFETKVNTSAKISADDGFNFDAVSGNDSQSAIWRFAGSLGFIQGFMLACGAIVKDLITTPFSSKSRASLLGRLSKFVSWHDAVSFRDFADQAPGPQSNRISFQDAQKELPLSGMDYSSERRAA
jgi:hypothetical protein